MSADEDTELRDLVAQTLETNGVLGKIRAQLRASVFLALEEQESVKNKTPFLNKNLKTFLESKEGQVVTCLVREFLEFFRLDYTTTVFEPESGSKGLYEGRQELARDLDIIESGECSRLPLLAEVVRRSSGHVGAAVHAHPEDMPQQLLDEAREKFQEYDADESGSIDKDELRQLFCDIFPDFNRNMLDRYVNDEFRAYDKDFSNSIDFMEFLDMYKRLFVLSKSVVSQGVHDLMRHNSPRSNLPDVTTHKHPVSKAPAQAQSGGLPSVEEMNRKNREESEVPPRLPATPPPERRDNHVRDLLTGSDPEDDSFFDDQMPKNNDRLQIASNKDKQNGGDRSTAYEYEESPRPRSPETDRSIRSLDKKFSDLGMDVPHDDDYDEDFESTRGISSVAQTPRDSARLSPRSARTESVAASIPEEIDDLEDDLDEELSGANDLLHSDNSNRDDLTTDRTVSPHEISQAFDYVEQVHVP